MVSYICINAMRNEADLFSVVLLWYEGAMLTNTRTPDGYLVGADGKWVKE